MGSPISVSLPCGSWWSVTMVTEVTINRVRGMVISLLLSVQYLLHRNGLFCQLWLNPLYVYVYIYNILYIYIYTHIYTYIYN